MPPVKRATKSVKKSVKKSRVSRRTVAKHASPSPSRMRKFQEAFNAAVSKAKSIEPKASSVKLSKSILKSSKKPAKSSKVVKFSKSPQKSRRGQSAYQIFVKDFMTRSDMRDKSGPERMKKAAEAWRQSK